MNPSRTLWGTFTIAAICASALFAVCTSEAFAGASAAGSNGATLKGKYDRIHVRLESSPYGRPLWLEAREQDHTLAGDAYAVIAQPFEKVSQALTPAGNWCEVLILPFNVKNCSADGNGHGSGLSLLVGRKGDTPDEDAYKLNFRYAIATSDKDYFELALTAPEGPLGTRDYRLVLQATPIDARRTFIHLTYSYGYGTLGKAAMQAYLATAGASKVGFSKENGELVGGMRGVMERNTMRYFLAIDAYLASLEAPPARQAAKRINDWFSGVEHYPRQLDEKMSRADYVAMKTRHQARLAGGGKASGG